MTDAIYQMDHTSAIHGVRQHQARIDAGEVTP